MAVLPGRCGETRDAAGCEERFFLRGEHSGDPFRSFPAVRQDSASSAEEATDDQGGLAAIVVTARRVAENLQETPVSVTSIGGADLANRSIASLSEIQAATPSLTIVPAAASPTSSYFSIRGQVLSDIRVNIDPTVGVYVDDIYLPRAIGVDAGNLIDIDRIEVLKGPQGTLYGRNTTGGAVNIFTRTPSDAFEATLRGRLGSYGDRSISGVVNLPVGETFALRAVGEKHDRDGFGTNRVTGNKFGARDGYLLRGSARWEPLSGVEIVLRGDYARDDATSTVWKPMGPTIGSAANRQIAVQTGLDNASAAAAYLAFGGTDQDGAMNIDPNDRIKIWGYSATVSVDLSDAVSLKSITANRGFRRASQTDFDGSPFSVLGFDIFISKDKQFSQELQLNGTLLDRKLSWITGLYYSNEDAPEYSSTIATPALSATNPSIGDVKARNRAYGVFGQVSYHFSDQLSATAGVRYSKDKRQVRIVNRNATSCLSLGRPLTAGPCDPLVRRADSDAVSYTGSIEFKPTGDIMVYVKTSRSYRSGGIPTAGGSATSPASAAEAFVPFAPETVTDYEAGLKSEFFDRRLRANLAVFHSKYDNIQRSEAALIPGTTQSISRIRNIAAGKISGIEVELTARPVEALELSANGAYLNTMYTRYTVGTIDRSGDRFQWVPKWSYSLSGAYTLDFVEARVRAQVDYSWQDELVTTTQAAVRPSLGLLNARLAATFDEVELEVALFGRNLTNESYWASPVDTRLTTGQYVSPLGAPRTWGLEFTKHF